MLNWDWSCFCPHRWTQMGLDGARWTKWTSSVIPFVTHTAISTQMADAWYVCPWTRGTWRQTHYPSYVSKWATTSRQRWNSFSFCHRSGHLYWVGFDMVFQFSSISQSSHKLIYLQRGPKRLGELFCSGFRSTCWCDCRWNSPSQRKSAKRNANPTSGSGTVSASSDSPASRFFLLPVMMVSAW